MTRSLSRRRFLKGSTATVVLGAVMGAIPRAGSAMSGSNAPPFRAGGAGNVERIPPWLARDMGAGAQVPRPWRWRRVSSGAALEILPDRTVAIHEPGWGSRVFAAADFSSGHPQEAIRRSFGESALEELRQALIDGSSSHG